MPLTKESFFQHILTTLKLPAAFAITEESEPGEIPGWDSLGWINLINVMEEEYGAEIPLEDMDDILTVGDFFRVVEKCQARP